MCPGRQGPLGYTILTGPEMGPHGLLGADGVLWHLTIEARELEGAGGCGAAFQERQEESLSPGLRPLPDEGFC